MSSSDNHVVIASIARTPVGAFSGGLASLPASDLGAIAIGAALERAGVEADAVDVYWVPGAWELPQAAKRIAALDRHDALIALGCVIRGETPHFDYVAGEASSGLGAVAREIDVPLLFGVLTTDTPDQAWARASRESGNKGGELAHSALHMIGLYESLED